MKAESEWDDNRMKKRLIIIVISNNFNILLALTLVLGFSLAVAAPALAATITSTATGGVWATGSTWVGGIVPATTDSVVIATTGTGKVTVGAAATCAGVTINNGATLSLTTFNLTVNGSWANNGIETASSTGQIYFSSTATISGTGTNSTESIINNSAYTVNSTGVSLGTLYVGAQNGTGKLILGTGADVTINALSVGASGTAANAGTLETTAGATLTVGTLNIGRTGGSPGSINMSSGGTLKITGAPGAILNGGTWTPGTGTVEYSGAGQALPATFLTTYNNLTASGSGTKTLGVAVTISGNLTVGSGTTLDLSTFTANRSAGGGTLSVAANGALKIGGTNTFPSNYSTHSLAATSTVEYSGTAQTITAENYGNLTLSGSGGKTMPVTTTTVAGNLITAGTISATAGAALTVGGTVALGSGTAFTAGAFTHNVAGDWTNNGGTFTNTGSTINFNGSSSEAIGGTASTTFNNLTINNSAGVTLGSSETVAGILTLINGQVTSTPAFLLAVTNTASSAVTGSSSASYVNGPLQWSLATGSSYLFPVGDAANYRPFELNSITCASPVVRVTMSSIGASTVDATLASVAARNWFTQLISGSFTSATVRMTESGLGSTNVVASSAAQSGAYTNRGGNSIGSTVTSNAGISYTGSTYFAIGTLVSGSAFFQFFE